MNKLLNILLISAILLLSTHHARADDETKRLIGGIAAGLVGMAINEIGKENDEQVSEDIEWNEQQQPKPKLEYSDDVAEAQIKLKKLGYYNGKIDGLKGRGTTEAIRTWEHHARDGVADGEISQEEMDTLRQQISNSEQPKMKNDSKSEKTISADNDQGQKRLYKAFYSFEGQNAAYQACMKFKETGNPYARYIDQTFERNFQAFEKLYDKQMKTTAECYGITAQERNQIKERAESNYKKSDEAKMYQLVVAMVISGQDDIERFIKGCNTISQSFSLLYTQSKDEKIDQKTCKFTK